MAPGDALHSRLLAATARRRLALAAVAAGSLLAPLPSAGEETTTLRGQLVCSLCWFEADRVTVAYGADEDRACAARCAKAGIPPALAVDEGGRLELYVLAGPLPFDPRLRGRELLRGYPREAGATVDLTGVARERDGQRTLHVRSARKVAPGAACEGGGPRAPGAPFALTPARAAAPDLVLADLAGVKQKLSRLRGKIVVLNFWATWCPPCRAEMPALAAIHARYAARGVQLVGAAADGDADRVGAFARDQRITFPLWLSVSADELRGFGFTEAIPATAVLDPQGLIAWRKQGPVSESELAEEIERLLGEQRARSSPDRPRSPVRSRL